MKSKSDTRNYVLGLGAAGAVAVMAAAALAYAVSFKRKRPAYSRQEWSEALSEIGTIRNFEGIVDDIADRGIHPDIRADAWPFLLEVFDYNSTFQQRQQQHQLMVRQYQQLLLQCQAYEAALKESSMPSSHCAAGLAPASAVQYEQQQQQQQQQQQPRSVKGKQHSLPEQVRQFAEAHRIIIIDAVRTDFQKHSAAMGLYDDSSGCCSSSREDPGRLNSSAQTADAGFIDSSTFGSGVVHLAGLVSQGWNGLQQYWLGNFLGGQAAAWGHRQALWVSEAAQLVLETSSHMSEESKRQASRMAAMLSAYALHDPDMGYCQGMSDLLLPFLLLFEDDALAFWCFVAVMQRQGVRRNFAVDESGIFSQLRTLAQVLEEVDKPLMFRLHQLGAAECHFAYRMVVVMMRRDLPIGKVMHLWELLWANAWRQRRPSHKMAMYTAAAHSEDSQVSSDSDVDSKTAQPVAMQVVADSRACRSYVGCSSWANNSDFNLFTCFVAAVVISQRRVLLGHCYDADDVLRTFHSLHDIDVWQCLHKAQEIQRAVAAQHYLVH